MKALIALLGAFTMAAQAQNVTSVAQADAALEQVAKDRAAVHEEFAASERECSTKFFVNNCLDKAKEKRRAALAAIRAPKSTRALQARRLGRQARRRPGRARAQGCGRSGAARAQPPKPPHEEKAARRRRPAARGRPRGGARSQDEAHRAAGRGRSRQARGQCRGV
jgi:hypothetical protein